MATPEDEIKDLKEKNNELVQKVQHWKITAAQRENEKLDLMKEINELRLKLSRIRSGGAAQARKLETALQSACEDALSHLVQASGTVARTVELAKTYMRDRQELDDSSPRWSNIGGTPKTERVHRVLPMMMDGHSIQPVVSLSRTLLTNNLRPTSRSSNQTRNITERAMPMHMLQDVYIPLTRIDANELPGNNMEVDTESNDMEDSADNLEQEDGNERSLDDSQNITEEDIDVSRRLDAVTEEDIQEEVPTPPSRSRIDNPLEGPSWMLDVPPTNERAGNSSEPDSTTQLDESSRTPGTRSNDQADKGDTSVVAFSPTVRRRKRPSSPYTPDRLSPRPARRFSNSGRVLKVLVAKMRLEESPPGSPRRASRAPRLEAPSPNGSTTAGLIVSETLQNGACGAGGDNNAVTERNMYPILSLTPLSISSQSTPETSRDAPANKDDNRDSPLTRFSNQKQKEKNQRSNRAMTSRGNGNVESNSSQVNVASTSSRTKDGQSQAFAGESFMSHDMTTRQSDNRSLASLESRDSDSGGEREGGRTRRPRKAVTYKEKPLNRKMRR